MEEINSKEVIDLIKSGTRTDFSNCVINGDSIINLHIDAVLKLQNSVINGRFILETKDYISLIFNDATFFNEVDLKIIRGGVNLKAATFKSGLKIRATEHYNLDISETKFAGQINISDSKFSNIDLSGIEFISKTENDKFVFNKNEISGKTNAKNSAFHNAVFNATKFKQSVTFDNTEFNYIVAPSTGNFFNCVFDGDSYWNNVEFDKGCFFNGSIFHGSALFVGVSKGTSCVGDFSGAIFYKRAVFDNSTFSKIAFNNCEFADMVSFKGVQSGFLEISKAVFLKGSDFLNAKIGNADKETFRIIKNEFQKINNQIEALRYRSKEMVAYEREFQGTKITTEKALLWLHRVSNEHGLNWWRGVKFTLLAGVLFYIVYLLIGLGDLPFQWGWISWNSFFEATGSTVKYFIRFFIPTHDLDFMNEFQPNAFGFFVDFIGRIFVGYGIYQTIQAFRKYGKL